MSVANKLLQAAAGGASDPVYVDDLFSTTLYTTIVKSSGYTDINTGVDCNTDGGMVWLKNRSFSSTNHGIFDTERTNGYYLPVNSNDNGGNIAIASASSPFIRTTGIRFTASGGTVNHNWFNREYAENVIWSFKRQEKFFDIVTYSGDGVSGRNISHNLGSVPGMIIVKRTSASENWMCYHRALDSSSPENYYIDLDRDAARDTLTEGWKNTAPTSDVFTVGNHDRVNASGHTYVAYLFAHNEQEFGEDSDEAIIHCGSYVADSTNGVAINCGFEPQWVLVKNVGAGRDWWLFDSMRGFTNQGTNDYLRPNLNNAGGTLTNDAIRPTATGFEVGPTVDNYSVNGDTHIYMAIARPHKPASEFAATDLFTPLANPGNSSEPYWTANHVIDAFWQKNTTSGGWYIGNRLTQGRELQFDSTAVEGGAGNHMFDYQTGVGAGASGTNAFRYLLRRAKGFFDIVSYKSNGSAATHSHNLGVVPELMFIKARSGAGDSWVIWDKNADLSTSTPLFADFTQARRYAKQSVNATAPTASVFSVGAAGYSTGTNGETYLVYLFASVAGISKIGTYSGTGSDVNVDCGFSAGARFVLIWRTDSSGPGWYVYDSVRGIVAGNDPYYLLGSNAAQVTDTDYIDPLNAGFTVTSSAPAALNNNGGTYAFLAIA